MAAACRTVERGAREPWQVALCLLPLLLLPPLWFFRRRTYVMTPDFVSRSMHKVASTCSASADCGSSRRG